MHSYCGLFKITLTRYFCDVRLVLRLIARVTFIKASEHREKYKKSSRFGKYSMGYTPRPKHVAYNIFACRGVYWKKYHQQGILVSYTQWYYIAACIRQT